MEAGVVPLVRPPRLGSGDRVAVVAPSGPVPAERLDAGIDVLRGWGLAPVVLPHVLEAHPRLPYLAGDDEDRARDLEDAWCDPRIAAVLCARGGFGAQRTLDVLDWARMRDASPKAFVGYSDVTTLHEALATRLGVAALYGPMVADEVFATDAATQGHLRTTLLDPETTSVVTSSTARTLVPGRAHGVTAGGCLTVLAADLGAPGARASLAGAILLLEDVGIEPYELDRALTQLRRGGLLDGLAGIALGSWAGPTPYEHLRPVLVERLGGLGIPVIEELGFGHGRSALTVPLGVPCTLDADACTLTFDVPALT